MGNNDVRLNDSLTSLVSRMGTDRDKAATVFYTHPTLDDGQALAAYRGSWLPRKIVDIPALDSCRKWRDWQAKNDEIELIEAEENRLNLKGKVLDALIKARLLGGGAIFIGTGDANPEEPLDYKNVSKGGLKYLTVLSKRDMSAGPIDQDVNSEFHGKPSYYEVTGNNAMVRIHPSRLVIFAGAKHPDILMMGIQDGWGDSVLTATLDAIKNADSTAGNIASLVFEAKIDIIRLPNFMASLGNEEYKRKILERYTLANMSKGINGTLLLDKEEEYETKSAQLAGLTDILMAFMQIVSGAADIPVTRLLGQSPAGMNATGTSDMKNYHDRIQSIQQLEMTPALHKLDEVLIRSSLGKRPPEIHYVWSPLEQMSEKERADIFKLNADAARQLVGSGTGQEIITREAVSKALVNRLVEDGVLPGLEDAVDEFGGIEEQDPTEEELAAAAGAAQAANTNNVTRMQQAANDAAPRTLYVSRKVINAAEIIAWAKGQGFKTTLTADDLHVTIAYSRTPVDWMKVGESWASELKVAAGGPRLMERFGEARVLLFKAAELDWRHENIKAAGASWDHPEYQSHITISYDPESPVLLNVEPYQGEIILGPELFAEVKEDRQAGISEE